MNCKLFCSRHTACPVVLFLSILVIASGSRELSQNLTVKQNKCLEDQQYPAAGLCCLNCAAGTFVSKPCTQDLQQGTCSPCEPGRSYTEHPNGMDRCLQCTQCRMDQTVTEPCSSRRDTQCQCKTGFFCVPDQACEVCKKCTRCKVEEEEVKKCTPTSNTICEKLNPPLDSATDSPATTNFSSHIAMIAGGVILLIFCLSGCAVGGFCWCKSQSDLASVCECPTEDVKIPIEVSPQSAEEKQNTKNAGLEEGEEPRPESSPLLQETQGIVTKGSALEDEDRGLGDSLPNTTSSSQTSLTAVPAAILSGGETPDHSPPMMRPNCSTDCEPEHWSKDEVLNRRLVPLLGEETSLSKSFDLFDTFLDVRFHNKFFRSIGVSDNAIKIAESSPAADKVYELLCVWMQREGLRANINDLIQALLQLDQRYSAENIATKAVERGFYRLA
ncbi:tumor necrosis factor receptor superfamily, member a isoform X1 [Alosa sapidissima]|uniref:tumor necrosis factor receptor superfamily, member a isoform X1 n=1 Tax=Alosa sapidissima TaxID=34773 RepID=UPI001C0969C2|nr:tumor necrosis factor receptor superfamily, member a isoform X1 [Alosa sapidissima]